MATSPDSKTIEQLKAAHGELRMVAGVVFRQPHRAEWDRYTDKLLSDKTQISRAARELAAACVVWPDSAALTKALDDRPALLLNQILSALTEMAGADDEEEVKKL